MPDRWAIFRTPTGRVCWQFGDINEAQVPSALENAKTKLGVPAGWQNIDGWDVATSVGVPHEKTLTASQVRGPDGSMQTAAQVNALLTSARTTMTTAVASLGRLLGG